MNLSLSLPITSFIALPLTLLMVGMAFKIGTMRRKFKIGQGDKGNKALAKMRAAHSNAVDNIPLGLILLAMAEIQGVEQNLLILTGGLFVAARALSAVGLIKHTNHSTGRFYGIVLTWLSLLALALLNLSVHLL